MAMLMAVMAACIMDMTMAQAQIDQMCDRNQRAADAHHHGMDDGPVMQGRQ